MFQIYSKMTTFFHNTILAAYCFFFGLAINYYLGKHTLNLGKPHIEQSPLIGNVNYATAFSARGFLISVDVLHMKMFKKFFFSTGRSIMNLIVLKSVVVATGVQRADATTITTTTPAKAMLSIWQLKFTFGRCNICTKCFYISISCTFSTPVFTIAPINVLSSVDESADGLKIKPFNLGSSLKDNTQPQFQKCHHHYHHHLLKLLFNCGFVSEVGLWLIGFYNILSVEGQHHFY